jgi:predicted RNase H-like nuclease (RuvC/YqgF family)
MSRAPVERLNAQIEAQAETITRLRRDNENMRKAKAALERKVESLTAQVAKRRELPAQTPADRFPAPVFKSRRVGA